MLHANIRIITVLMAVARSESTPLMPILAKTATREAKTADNNAYIHHIKSCL
jgi:hypothetical protein